MIDKHNVILLGLFDTAIMTARCFQGIVVRIYGMDYERKHLGFYSNLINAIETPNPINDEKVWLNFVLQWLKENSKGKQFIIIPTSDFFVQLYVKYQNEFSEHCLALHPSESIIEMIIDRSKQFAVVATCGIKVPSYIVGHGLNADPDISNIIYPIAIKPLDAPKWRCFFNNKGFVINTVKEFRETYSLIKGKDVEYIIQTIIQGDNTQNFEINSLLLPDGRIWQHSIRKLRQFPDRFGTATCIESCSMPELEKMTEALLRKLNIYGFSNVEFKYNQADGNYYYIETNPRVWLQVNFSKEIGINFPQIYCDYLLNKKIEPINHISIGEKWVDFVSDIYYWIKYKKKYNVSFLSFMKTWYPVKATSLISFKDPHPFLKDLRLIERLTKKR